MALGMSYDEYWNGDCMLVKYYRQAERIRQRRMNSQAWLQGRYVYDAIMAVAPVLIPFNKHPKPGEYPKEPYPIDRETREAAEKKRMEMQKAKFMAKIGRVNEQLRKQKEGDGNAG